jgi:RNA polymerase sigma-70 factor (ECF subfamily)
MRIPFVSNGETAPAPAGSIRDEVLMMEVRGGQIGKLAILFERHHRQLFSFFYRLTASRELSEDLVQDVFFRLLKFRETYVPKTSFSAWMYQVARNAHIDAFRKRKSEAAWPESNHEPASPEPHMEERLRRRQDIALLQRALSALPADKREVLVLSRYQNLKYHEIGEILGCEVGAVKLRVYRAVRALGQIFAEMSGERAS